MDESILLALQGELESIDGSNKTGKILNCLSLLRQNMPEGAWVGFYVDNGKHLALSYFQGTPACEVIAYGKGVVGVCYETEKEQIVDDVHAFSGYICCDETAASEYCTKVGNAVFDIDYPKGKLVREDVSVLRQAALLLGRFLIE